jgi:SAM-dependent methyltransferase
LSASTAAGRRSAVPGSSAARFVDEPAIDPAADARFRLLVRSLGLEPDNPWVGGYVAYEWRHGRHVYQTVDAAIEDKRYLEFGCNYGATSVVLAALGACVVGVDVDMSALLVALANAERHGMSDRTAFVRCSSEARLPFQSATFDRIVCNSVLEYLPNPMLPAWQRELDRVLRPGGLLFITGTSNRLAPREIHSRRWFTNYLPRWATASGDGTDTVQRGVNPRQVLVGFGDYENLDWEDGGRAYLEARARMSASGGDTALRKVAHRVARLFGVSLGLVTPSLSVTLRKRS